MAWSSTEQVSITGRGRCSGDRGLGHGASTCITIRGTAGDWVGTGATIGSIPPGIGGDHILTPGAGGGLMHGTLPVAQMRHMLNMVIGLP